LGQHAEGGPRPLPWEDKYILLTLPQLTETSKKACLRQEELTRSSDNNLQNSEILESRFRKAVNYENSRV
jgi:hypothetical protein